MKTLIWTANIAGWAAVQVGIARWMLHRPAEPYREDSWLTRERRWEAGGQIYRWTGVRYWKRFLPAGAMWLRSSEDRQLVVRGRTDLRRFSAETRRAEHAHWYMLCCVPLFFLWNPRWGWIVMAVYGVLTNVPCILAQRLNRIRVRKAQQTMRRFGV